MTIQTNGLFKAYGRNDALRGLSLSVPEGAAFALIVAQYLAHLRTLYSNWDRELECSTEHPAGGVAAARRCGPESVD